ncbi:conserved hypothetical protein [Magnetococcus marinus MC-1]|uniref:DUF2817 domain-containing protein n=1 Tax=Magnetococcus marinus (strain ATCC BAA-1437 / JCM 17883 / MC-1) TaxID=156889 RepID=A0L457_MAGMM|nr:M14 family metallopeptidase [Magnetococcus marinus]ABK42750.1 conserved hypothetical protein [Magnetococcus marinus MC-1]
MDHTVPLSLYRPLPVVESLTERLFPATSYQQLREHFLAAAKGCPHRHMAYVHPLRGSRGEELAMDVVRLGHAQCHATLVITSACHGVEGPAGSALQSDLLRHALLENLPAGVEILLIHGLNPYGFSWGRRVDEKGVDLNRNFVDFASPLPFNQDYNALAEAILPRELNPASLQHAQAQRTAYRQQHGEIRYDHGVAAGQYSDPHGLFYGGVEPSWSRQTLEKIWQHFGLTQRVKIAVVDIHTGIGPHGYGELICDLPPGGVGSQRAQRWYGASVTHPVLGGSASGVRYGLTDYGWLAAFGERLSFVTLEFGTGPFDTLLQVLQGDHWCHRQKLATNHPTMQHWRKQLEDFFNPPSASWQEMVIWRGRQVIRQTLEALADPSRPTT